MSSKQQPAIREVEPYSDRGVIIALDVGARRIGVATATAGVWIASPTTTVINDQSVWDNLGALIASVGATRIIVGLPRNLNGDDTQQTSYARTFADDLATRTGLPIVLQDEAVTSRQAEAELRARGKPYSKGDIDALAATYILEDYIKDML